MEEDKFNAKCGKLWSEIIAKLTRSIQQSEEAHALKFSDFPHGAIEEDSEAEELLKYVGTLRDITNFDDSQQGANYTNYNNITEKELSVKYHTRIVSISKAYVDIQLASLNRSAINALRQEIATLKRENNAFLREAQLCFRYLTSRFKEDQDKIQMAKVQFEEVNTQKDMFSFFLTNFESFISTIRDERKKAKYFRELRVINKSLAEIGFRISAFICKLNNGKSPYEENEAKLFRNLLVTIDDTAEKFTVPSPGNDAVINAILKLTSD